MTRGGDLAGRGGCQSSGNKDRKDKSRLTFRFRFRPGPDRFAGLGQPPNPELDFGSGSAPMLNFGPDLGPVHQSSGPDQSSEPNCGNPMYRRILVPTLTLPVHVAPGLT